MAKSRDERHRYGQHYTPHEVARLLAAFAVRSPNDLVFDPSCGDGRLLEEALTVKRRLAARQRSRYSDLSAHIFGVERSSAAVQTARRTGACVAAADFFDVAPGARLDATLALPLEFNAIIGNPPYIRQEVIGPSGKRRIETRLAHDRLAAPAVSWPRWSGRSDIYVYFFAHSIRFLKEHGRLVFLTASSWLDAGYGAALREFLLGNFRVIAVIESAAESFFADASINTCITVLERESDWRVREDHSIRFVQFNRSLSQILEERRSQRTGQADPVSCLARDIQLGEVLTDNESYRIRAVAQSELLRTDAEEKTERERFGRGWGKYVRADEVFFKVLERGSSSLLSLSHIASVRFGVKTGANEFFYVKEEAQSARGKERSAKTKGQRAKSREGTGLLALRSVASVRRGITTGANEFFYLSRVAGKEDKLTAGRGRRSGEAEATNGLTSVRDFVGGLREIESELLSPVVFSLKEISGIRLDRVEARRMLFNCSLTSSDLAGTRGLDYIKSGERAGFHHRPTCSNREPWYSVARGMKPAPLILPSKVGERWLVALNRARVFEDKKLYGVFPARGVSALVLAALLNSTWARYCVEVTCRQMTGAQAIADIDVAVAEQIMLPDPRKLPPVIKEKLETAVADLSRRPVYSVFEEIKRADRRRLDGLVLEAIGFDKRSEREAVLKTLYAAVLELVRVRLSKSRSVAIDSNY